MIAPSRIRGGPAAARVGAIDDVVVDQRGAVDQLDDGGKPDGAFAPIAGVACGKQEKSRPQALSAPSQQIAANLRDRLEGGSTLAGQFALDEGEVITDKIENFFCSQQGDGPLLPLARSAALFRRQISRGRR